MLTVEELAIVPELEHVWMKLVTVTEQHQWGWFSEWIILKRQLKNVITVILLAEVIFEEVIQNSRSQVFYRVAVPRAGFRGGRGGHAPPPSPRLFFEITCSFFKSLWRTANVLFEVELIINNTPLIYVYPNAVEICLTLDHLLFGR